MKLPKKIWTIGHSTRSIEEFIEILHTLNIGLLADVRSYPGSKRYPQFNKEFMAKVLPENGIQYNHIVKLGGRRKTSPQSKNTAWRSPAFRGYADHMETQEFKQGVEELLDAALENRSAIMCSEALWWNCHRSIISDYLKSVGIEVLHIMGKDKSEEHSYTKAARIVNGKLSYEEEFELKF